MRPIKWIFPFLCAVAFCLTGQDTGVVHFFVVSETGKPIEKATIKIEGIDVNRIVEVRHGAEVRLPYGVYNFACTNVRGFAPSFKVARVERPHPIDVIFGLPLENPGQTFGEGSILPFEISGDISPAPKGVFGRVKVVGIFTEDSADAKVDSSGRFRIALRNEGVYALYVLYANKIVHERTLDLTFATPRQINLRIQNALTP